MSFCPDHIRNDDTSERKIYRAKRLDDEEIVENTVLKPHFTQNICRNLYEDIKKAEDELVEAFSLLKTPTQPSPTTPLFGKRKRSESDFASKRKKTETGSSMEMILVLEKGDLKESFRVHTELELGVCLSPTLYSECDNDCETDLQELEYSVEVLRREISKALYNV